MAITKRLFKSFSRLFLPVFILVVGSIIVSAVLLVQRAAFAPKARYLVTPAKYGQLSSRGSQITDETWQNTDGSTARGWLLRGTPGSPAVILLHAYGADRSYVLNLGVKLNEATDFTILMPDERGHGDTPHVKNTSFGGHETEDVLAAVKYLRSLKPDGQTVLVGQNIGIYGTEMGALTGEFAAGKDESIKSLVLDSIPNGSDDLLARATVKRYPFASFITTRVAKLGTYMYYYDGFYRRDSACDVAKELNNRQVLLLAGADAPEFQTSTTAVSRCFPDSTKIETKTDLNPSGYNITNASLEQSETYDQRVIGFFKQSLGTPEVIAQN
ncbi:MAG TPA: alpha/beta fold hydrolase [Pyrinomonadaceae bacterium]|nr:alpha/beta fold hydrolase [Pyrinomonadaceae bacterium]